MSQPVSEDYFRLSQVRYDGYKIIAIFALIIALLVILTPIIWTFNVSFWIKVVSTLTLYILKLYLAYLMVRVLIAP